MSYNQGHCFPTFFAEKGGRCEIVFHTIYRPRLAFGIGAGGLRRPRSFARKFSEGFIAAEWML
jgi:hypothetical protein